MKVRHSYRLPDDKARALRRAQRLEVVSIVTLVGIAILMFVTMGQPQAMKARRGS